MHHRAFASHFPTEQSTVRFSSSPTHANGWTTLVLVPAQGCWMGISLSQIFSPPTLAGNRNQNKENAFSPFRQTSIWFPTPISLFLSSQRRATTEREGNVNRITKYREGATAKILFSFSADLSVFFLLPMETFAFPASNRKYKSTSDTSGRDLRWLQLIAQILTKRLKQTHIGRPCSSLAVGSLPFCPLPISLLLYASTFAWISSSENLTGWERQMAAINQQFWSTRAFVGGHISIRTQKFRIF